MIPSQKTMLFALTIYRQFKGLSRRQALATLEVVKTLIENCFNGF